jgi:transcriptional regulator with XRE-family HTH domain
MSHQTYPKLRDLLKSHIGRKENQKTQAEVALVVGVSQETVSYWVNGKKRPSLTHVKPLSICLGIKYETLLMAADYDMATDDISELNLNEQSLSYFELLVRSIVAQVLDVPVMRFSGNRPQAIVVSERLRKHFQEIEQSMPKSKRIDLLRKLHAQLIIDAALAHLKNEPSPAIDRELEQLRAELWALAEQEDLSEYTIGALTQLYDGIQFYLRGDYETAIKHLKYATDLDIKSSLVYVLKMLAVSYAYLGREREFIVINEKMEQLLRSDTLPHIGYTLTILETQARCFGLLHNTNEWRSYWDAGWKMVKQQEIVMPGRVMQFYRTKFEVLQKQGGDKEEMIRAAKEGLRLANEQRFERYAKLFAKGLKALGESVEFLQEE